MQHPSQPPLSTGTSQLATTRDLGSRFAGCDPLVPDHLVATCPRARRDERPVFQTGSLAGASPAVGAILTTSADCNSSEPLSHGGRRGAIPRRTTLFSSTSCSSTAEHSADNRKTVEHHHPGGDFPIIGFFSCVRGVNSFEHTRLLIG